MTGPSPSGKSCKVDSRSSTSKEGSVQVVVKTSRSPFNVIEGPNEVVVGVRDSRGKSS